jgi:hypothetical protein
MPSATWARAAAVDAASGSVDRAPSARSAIAKRAVPSCIARPEPPACSTPAPPGTARSSAPRAPLAPFATARPGAAPSDAKRARPAPSRGAPPRPRRPAMPTQNTCPRSAVPDASPGGGPVAPSSRPRPARLSVEPLAPLEETRDKTLTERDREVQREGARRVARLKTLGNRSDPARPRTRRSTSSADIHPLEADRRIFGLKLPDAAAVRGNDPHPVSDLAIEQRSAGSRGGARDHNASVIHVGHHDCLLPSGARNRSSRDLLCEEGDPAAAA